jgi:hypothetical protein
VILADGLRQTLPKQEGRSGILLTICRKNDV